MTLETAKYEFQDVLGELGGSLECTDSLREASKIAISAFDLIEALMKIQQTAEYSCIWKGEIDTILIEHGFADKPYWER